MPMLSIFHLLLASGMGLIALYVVIRVIFPARAHLALKLLLSLLAIAGAEKLMVMRVIIGPDFSALPGEVSAPALIAASFVQAVVVCLFLLALIRDLCLIVLRLPRFFRPAGAAAAPKARHGAGMLFFLAVLLAGYGTWEAVRVPEVRRVTIRVPNLPPALAGLRIAHLSDLHLGPVSGRDWSAAVVERANALHPDLVAVTGDSVDGHPDALAGIVAPLADLKAKYGVYLVTGNHEYYAGFLSWMAAFRALGLHVLLNSSEEIEIGGPQGRAPLVIAGVTDPTALSMRPPFPPPAPGEVLDAIRHAHPAGMPVTILLSHAPGKAAVAAAGGAAVQLSGHTHGGQILPFSPLAARANGGYVHGLYRVGEMSLYVSSGSGLWAGLPLRLLVPSEIVLITLQPAQP